MDVDLGPFPGRRGFSQWRAQPSPPPPHEPGLAGNGPKEGQIPEPGNPLVFSVRARKKGPAGDKIARFSPVGADGPVNKSNPQF